MNQGLPDPSGCIATTSSDGLGRCRAQVASVRESAPSACSSESDSGPKTRRTTSGHASPM